MSHADRGWTEGPDRAAPRRGPYQIGTVRARLLDEALDILEHEGLQALNLRDLAARAGITAGSLYHHFDGKAALLAELAAAGFEELRRRVEKAGCEAAEGGRVRAWALAYFGFAQDRPALYALMFDPTIAHAAQVAQARALAVRTIQVLVEGSPVLPRSTAPLDTIALAVWAAAHGAASLTLSGAGGPQLMDDVILGLEGLFLRR
ncbi:MAG: TetR/AcrR family transcriptional regulator [Phenylobacterium sp.]|jgi:AcrR family transcriptional regulator|uniref:TetR/AcrR family transcriptional regulator n=1 Tax=Phenylobacterium sp. TaxID=1871053 RepID=UPI002A298A29|nr:TetR/AcrR family transcriptional regulator [Phenylobacterium sp.]MDD3838274.1 TetR/AcrR family transcriptional regulator [Phenylobacterium sp.]MDX9996932.1 TetR/AcrR family transcriptional regulator [Phenylobacterium sp.]